MSRVLWTCLALTLVTQVLGNTAIILGQEPNGAITEGAIQDIIADAVANRSNRWVEQLEKVVDLKRIKASYKPSGQKVGTLTITVPELRSLAANDNVTVKQKLRSFLHEAFGQAPGIPPETAKRLEEEAQIEVTPIVVRPDPVGPTGPTVGPTGPTVGPLVLSNCQGEYSINQFLSWSPVCADVFVNSNSSSRCRRRHSRCYPAPCVGSWKSVVICCVPDCNIEETTLSSRPIPRSYVSRVISAEDIVAAGIPNNGLHLVSTAVGELTSPRIDAVNLGGAAGHEIAMRYYGTGFHLYWSHDFRAALENLDRATRFCSDDPRIWYFKGLTEQELDMRLEAAKSFATATTLLINNDASRHPVAWALERVQGQQRLAFSKAEMRMRLKLSNPPKIASSREIQQNANDDVEITKHP